MRESNYDILGISENATEREIRDAFRRLALQFHTDRGGEDEKFKKVKQAYEDLKAGKKYPVSDEERRSRSKVYSGEDEEEIRRRNRILAKELAVEMRQAELWAAALNRSKATDTKLFGSKTLGEIEFERKANGALSVKGNIMAGSLTYDGPIIMQGNITSPSFLEEHKTHITTKKGDFKFVNPLENKYKIENGATITAEEGNIIVGNVFGRKDKVQDPDGKVGIYIIKEHRTRLYAPRGKIIAENIVNTVTLDADTIVVLNLEDDVIIKGREILIYGSKLTYDVVVELKKGGIMRFFESYSVQGLSNDAIIKLENGKRFRLQDLKTRKIKSLPEEFIASNGDFGKDDTLVGKGFTITYQMLDNFEKKSKKSSSWISKIGLGK